MSEPDKPILEGEILRPGESRQHYEEHVSVKFIKLGWFARLAIAVGVIALIGLGLFLSFWLVVFSLPVIAGLAIWSWLKRLSR